MTTTERDTATKSRTQKPKRYTVLFLNDDFTPIEFVMEILAQVFNQSHDEAEKITMTIHRTGKCAVGLYTHEIAETKAAQAMKAAKQFEFPLTCQPEPA